MTDIHLIVEGKSACGITKNGGLPPSMFREVTCSSCQQDTVYELCVAMEFLRNRGHVIPDWPHITLAEAIDLILEYEVQLPRRSVVRLETVKAEPRFL